MKLKSTTTTPTTKKISQPKNVNCFFFCCCSTHTHSPSHSLRDDYRTYYERERAQKENNYSELIWLIHLVRVVLSEPTICVCMWCVFPCGVWKKKRIKIRMRVLPMQCRWPLNTNRKQKKNISFSGCFVSALLFLSFCVWYVNGVVLRVSAQPTENSQQPTIYKKIKIHKMTQLDRNRSFCDLLLRSNWAPHSLARSI